MNTVPPALELNDTVPLMKEYWKLHVMFLAAHPTL